MSPQEPVPETRFGHGSRGAAGYKQQEKVCGRNRAITPTSRPPPHLWGYSPVQQHCTGCRGQSRAPAAPRMEEELKQVCPLLAPGPGLTLPSSLQNYPWKALLARHRLDRKSFFKHQPLMSQWLQNSALIIQTLHLETNRKKCFSLSVWTVLLFSYFKAGDYFFFCSRVLIHFLQVSCCFLRENSLMQEDICQKTSVGEGYWRLQL